MNRLTSKVYYRPDTTDFFPLPMELEVFESSNEFRPFKNLRRNLHHIEILPSSKKPHFS